MGKYKVDSVPEDLVERLLILPYLPISVYREHVGRVAREAAELIEQVRPRRIAAHVDWDRSAIIVNGQRRHLTQQQALILRRLVLSAGQLVTSDELVKAICEHRADGGPESVRVLVRTLMCTLRKKSPWLIRTRGRKGFSIEGYEPEPREPKPQAAQGQPMSRLMAGR